jgi:hypothetical protein
MTYGEIISQIKSIVYKGIWSDDHRLSSRHIIKTVLRKRARILKQEQEKKRLRERFSLQRIGCMELIPATKHECDCLPLKSNCNLVRKTKEKVPTPIKDFIHNVTSIDGSVLYSPTDFHEYNEYRRLKPLVGKPRYYISNQHIFVVDDEDKQFISIEAIFENPDEVNKVSCKDEDVENCYDPLLQDLAAAPDITDSIVTMSIEEILAGLRVGKEDDVNNASADDVDYLGLQRQLAQQQRAQQRGQ